MLVHQILKSKSGSGVQSVPADTKISEVASLLAKHRIGTVVVSEDGNSADGILSERDIVRELAKSGSGCLERSVGEYMTRKLVTCTPQNSSEDVLQQMTEGRFRHMPVIEGGVMVGLISIGDVVKAQLSQLAMEKDALEGMIMGH